MINGDEGSWKREGRVWSLAYHGRQTGEQEPGRSNGVGSTWFGASPWAAVALTLVCLCSLAADLAECKLVSFPIGIYKVLRNVTDQIHLITLANNELKSLTSKFMTTFCQLRGRPWLAQARQLAWLALTLQDLVGECNQGQPTVSWTQEIIPRGRL